MSSTSIRTRTRTIITSTIFIGSSNRISILWCNSTPVSIDLAATLFVIKTGWARKQQTLLRSLRGGRTILRITAVQNLLTMTMTMVRSATTNPVTQWRRKRRVDTKVVRKTKWRIMTLTVIMLMIMTTTVMTFQKSCAFSLTTWTGI